MARAFDSSRVPDTIARPSAKTESWMPSSRSTRTIHGLLDTVPTPANRSVITARSTPPPAGGATCTASRPQSTTVCPPMRPSSHGKSPARQVGHPCSASTVRSIDRQTPSHRSQASSRLPMPSVAPVSNLIASAASTAPTTNAAGPMIPAASHVGNAPGAGGSGIRHRRQAVLPGSTVSTRPSAPIAPPCTHGTPSRQENSLMMNLASKLSVPSTIASTPPSNSSILRAVRSAITGSTRAAELIRSRCRAAAAALGMPAATSASSKST